MDAAAKFYAVTWHIDDADNLAVFFTKKCHSPHFLGLINILFGNLDVDRIKDSFIHKVFHTAYFLSRKRRKMREVKPEPVRSNITAGLVYMTAQDFLEGSMQKVGCRMIAGNVSLAVKVDFKGDRLTHRESTRFYRS